MYFFVSAIPRQKTVTKISIKKLGKCRHKIQSFLPTKSPSERQYANILRTYIGLRPHMVNVYIIERINDQTTICAGGVTSNTTYLGRFVI